MCKITRIVILQSSMFERNEYVQLVFVMIYKDSIGNN